MHQILLYVQVMMKLNELDRKSEKSFIHWKKKKK